MVLNLLENQIGDYERIGLFVWISNWVSEIKFTNFRVSKSNPPICFDPLDSFPVNLILELMIHNFLY